MKTGTQIRHNGSMVCVSSDVHFHSFNTLGNWSSYHLIILVPSPPYLLLLVSFFYLQIRSPMGESARGTRTERAGFNGRATSAAIINSDKTCTRLQNWAVCWHSSFICVCVLKNQFLCSHIVHCTWKVRRSQVKGIVGAKTSVSIQSVK